MMNDAKIVQIQEGDKLLPGGQVERNVTARFLVGAFGPFTATVVKSDRWETDMRAEIQKTVASVQALQL